MIPMDDSPVGGVHQSEFMSGVPDVCPYCDEKLAHPSELDESIGKTTIWRRHRRVHCVWADVPEEMEGRYLSGDDGKQSTLPQDAQIATQQYEVTFHDEYVERVVVEAATKHEAKELAQETRTYDGELIQTLHTDRRELSEPSQASKEYLELFNLLPEDWDGDLDG